MNEEHYQEADYGRAVAEKVRDALVRKDKLVEVQGHRRDSSRVYQAKCDLAPDWLGFKKKKSTNLLKVRGESSRGPTGEKKKGKLIPLKEFDPETVAPLIAEMEIINEMMGRHPLQAEDRTTWDSCYRMFNCGDETGREWRKFGGRLYGDWQNKKSKERLKFTIGGDPVCEIDIKACYLFIANAASDAPVSLPEDPYQLISFVNDDLSRAMAKHLLSAMLSKEGEIKKFPRVGEGTTFREKYQIEKKTKVQELVSEIESAFPFLVKNKLNGLELMYKESELTIRSVATLADEGIPSFPVHDCLICRVKDKDRVVEVLRLQMKEQWGVVATLDIEEEGKEVELVRP